MLHVEKIRNKTGLTIQLSNLEHLSVVQAPHGDNLLVQSGTPPCFLATSYMRVQSGTECWGDPRIRGGGVGEVGGSVNRPVILQVVSSEETASPWWKIQPEQVKQLYVKLGGD